MVGIINTLLSALTVVGHAIFVAAFISLLVKKQKVFQSNWYRFVSQKAILLAFIVSVVATSGSLFYSEIAGYVPCTLCWFQRIFMYPLVIILGVALWKKDAKVFLYSLPLSIIGGVIALYHVYLQFGGNPLIPCSAVGYSVSCSQRFVLQFGYITIPIMALTAFALITLAMFVLHHRSKNTS